MAGRSIGLVVGHGSPRPSRPPAEQIRSQLAKILESKIFVQSERLRRFLRLTVERALAGTADQIKEYALGLEVFDRGRDFDPRVDSIVRVEARRLRRKLREYYQQGGVADTVVIEFPQGSYVPVFEYAAHPVALPVMNPSAAREAPALNSRTVAVLPFLNLSADAGQDFFCDGVSEEILNTLATFPELNVLARTSVFHFKGLSADVREIGEQLRAGTVIEGSVRKAGNRLRISVKAIDAATGVLRWSGRFDREAVDVFAIEDEIAQAVAHSLSLSLVPSHKNPVRSKRDLEAYTAYLKGCHYWNHVSQEGVQAALSEFTRAISLFPAYAPAHAGLANVYGHLTFWNVLPPGEGIPRAKQEALEALRLDEGMAGAYAILGILASCCEWNWDEGEKLLERAVELQPNNMTAHTYHVLHLLCRGQFKELTPALEKSFQLDPLSPWSFRNQGWAYYFQRQYDQAIEVLQTALALDPHFREAQFMLAYAYLGQARHDEAIAQLLALPAGPFDANRWGALGEVHGSSGNTAGARDALEHLDLLARTEYISPMSRLFVYAGMGEWDCVFEQMERAYADHCPWLCLLKVDPRYDPIRSDPRFKDLLKRMNLV